VKAAGVPCCHWPQYPRYPRCARPCRHRRSPGLKPQQPSSRAAAMRQMWCGVVRCSGLQKADRKAAGLLRAAACQLGHLRALQSSCTPCSQPMHAGLMTGGQGASLRSAHIRTFEVRSARPARPGKAAVYFAHCAFQRRMRRKRGSHSRHMTSAASWTCQLSPFGGPCAMPCHPELPPAAYSTFEKAAREQAKLTDGHHVRAGSLQGPAVLVAPAAACCQ